MYSFEGDFRRKPVQSLRGASKKEEKDELLRRNQDARQKREELRLKTENAVKIQKVYRGHRVRQKQNEELRQGFDAHLLKLSRNAVDVKELISLSSQLCHFYKDKVDGSRLVWVSQQVIKMKDSYLRVLLSEPSKGQQQIKNMLALCLRYLTTIGKTSQPIAIPLRMLEVFTATSSYAEPDVLCSIWKFLIDNGYFDCMRLLLNAKVPSSLEKSNTPPTPVSSTIFELIMMPIRHAASYTDKSFSHHVLKMVCKSLMCPMYTEQISQFLLPAMAYGKYPFPFVDLIQALISHCKHEEQGEGKNKGYGRASDRHFVKLELTPWLFGAFLMVGEKHLESMKVNVFSQYLQIVQRLFGLLPPRKNEDEEDSDSEEEMDVDDDDSLNEDKLSELREQCLTILDSQLHVTKAVKLVEMYPDDNDVIYSLSVICHNLMSQHRYSIHRKRLLYTLAYNSRFIRSVWRCCVSLSTISATKTETPLVIMLCRGLIMTERDMNRIVPVLSTFCSMFNHSLLTLHDVEFYGDSSVKSTSMPFSLDELVNMVITLRDVCLGIIELAHPDAKPTVNDDYRSALIRTGVKYNRNNNVKDISRRTAQWSYLFKVTASLVRQAYTRDTRRSFCPKDLWLSDRVKIQADGPSQIYRAQDSVFNRRPFRTMQTLARINIIDDDGGPPLSNKDVKDLVILTELPFVVPFQERVKILQKLIQNDKTESQGDFDHFNPNRGINVMIRRNFIYEDAFDKLSKANEPDLKRKMRVQLVNAAGMDEAGIDGGGIFREFLSVLLKTAFDPNRGFFSQTTDRVLYPNPQSSILTQNYKDHYYFIGRMLGKALYENMLVELPFAAFFLSKILSRTSGDLDIHHLASLDPEVYKNLLFLKHYQEDVAELGLDFTAVNNEFGETKVEELKPGGRNIPVTKANRIEYIHLMADYKLNKQIRTHTISFREGVSDLINLEWLRMFDHHELQVLVSGASVPINIEDLKQHTNYSGGYEADHPVIQMFWKTVDTFNDEQKRQLLKFITSCSRPPLLGFKDLYPALCIHYGGNEPERLPTASTCMNLLKLPECRDETTLKSKLLYAIESGAGFELS